MKFVIISSLVSLLMTGNPVVFNTTPANITQTPYGTITRDFTVVQDSPTVVKMGFFDVPLTQSYVSTFHYHFNKPAYGQFTMNYYKSVSDVRWEMVIDGGSVLSYTDSSVTIMVRGETDVYFSMIISSLQLAYNQQQFTLVSNQIIELADTDNELLQDIDDNLSYISSEQQLIQANTNTIKNILMSTFGGYVNNEGSLYTDMQSIIESLKSVSQYQNIDIEPSKIMAYRFFGNTTLPIMDSSNNYPYYIWNNINSVDRRIYSNFANQKITIVFGSDVTLNGYIYKDGNYVAQFYTTSIVVPGYRVYYTDITVPSGWNNYTMSLSNGNAKIFPIYVGPTDYIPEDVADILYRGYNNTYTRKIDQVISAIQNMAVNVNQMTVNATGITYNTTNNDVNTSVTNYENNITVVNNIENNFKQQFDNANQNYNVDNIPITNELVSTGNFMKDVTTQLYGLDIIKYPTALLLLGIVIIALLG